MTDGCQQQAVCSSSIACTITCFAPQIRWKRIDVGHSTALAANRSQRYFADSCRLPAAICTAPKQRLR